MIWEPWHASSMDGHYYAHNLDIVTCITGTTPLLFSIANSRASSPNTNQCSIKTHCARIQHRYLLSLIPSSLSFVGIEAVAQAKNTRDVPIFRIQKLKEIEERQEEESVKKVADIADVERSKKDASRIVLNAKGGSSLLSASIQAASIIAPRLLRVTLFHFKDKIWPKAVNIISSLKKKRNPFLMMMAGDHSSSAWHVAKAVGIEEVYSNLTLEDKLHQVKVLSRDGSQ